MRLTGAIPKQSNSTPQIRPPHWLNLGRKPELDLLPLELDFLYGPPSVRPYVTWLLCCGVIHSIAYADAAAAVSCGWFTARYKNTGEAVSVHPSASVHPSVRHLYGRAEQTYNAAAEKTKRRPESLDRHSILLWLEGSGSPPLSSLLSPLPSHPECRWVWS